MKARAAGGLLALGVVVLDQGSKLWLLDGLKMVDHERIVVTPFFDLILSWNPGISYSLFPQTTETGRWALVALTLAATILLALWLWRTSGLIAGLALGAIIGGALGNGFDRFAYGAVVDFCAFHAFGWYFYVFNLADTAITLGVVALGYDSLFAERGARRPDLRPSGP